jgi:hypothetical protein
MIVTCQQMQQLEEAAFARGISAEALGLFQKCSFCLGCGP